MHTYTSYHSETKIAGEVENSSCSEIQPKWTHQWPEYRPQMTEYKPTNFFLWTGTFVVPTSSAAYKVLWSRICHVGVYGCGARHIRDRLNFVMWPLYQKLNVDIAGPSQSFSMQSGCRLSNSTVHLSTIQIKEAANYQSWRSRHWNPELDEHTGSDNFIFP